MPSDGEWEIGQPWIQRKCEEGREGGPLEVWRERDGHLQGINRLMAGTGRPSAGHQSSHAPLLRSELHR
jgi:hypothetical protein